MQPDSQSDLANLILAFSICLFLALVCLLKRQHRRSLPKRVNKGLRDYVSGQNQVSEQNQQAA